MKCQILLFGKNKKIIINLLSAKLAQRVVKVKLTWVFAICIGHKWPLHILCVMYQNRSQMATEPAE